ncbi:hypothetical protein QBZ16_000994 [Prototheca wickerhamii]|uniref:ABC transporter domain-containing protein n=1 Tax=Prototheca wickerhamii TaxID=3111 RepID=A0AAD9MGB3_PROWI|nr:hypothetical protein QBZ16_000994 [Prototheca wickerhamii]
MSVLTQAMVGEGGLPTLPRAFKQGGLGSFVPERCAGYVQQYDVHFGELTVRETVDFAVQCQAAGHTRELLARVAAKEAELGIEPDGEVAAFMEALALGKHNSIVVEGIIRLLGLDVCAETVVGNQMLRGISGGQRKRLGTAEVGVGQQQFLAADEISTGLDSATTYDIVSALGAFAHIRRATFLIALLQPAPETFELFDDIILMSDGLVVYHGPREGVAEVFAPFGLVCPPRKGIADFLQEVTTPSDQQKYYVDNTKPYEYVTTGTLRRQYLKLPCAVAMEAELAAPYVPSDDDMALPTHPYAMPAAQLCKSNIVRTLTLTQRNRTFTVFHTTQICVMSFTLATLYLNTPTNTLLDGNLYLSAAFFSLIYMLLGGVTECHMLIMRLPVFYKQREMMFYPGWCFAVPSFLFRVPFCFVDGTLWSCIVYFAIGFSRSSRFFVFWLILVLTSVWSTSLLFMLIFNINGGFLVIKSAIPSWWIAAYWANPWAYITQSVAINEFRSSQWDEPNPVDPLNPTPLGIQILEYRDFIPTVRLQWIGVGAMLASVVINLAAFVLAMEFMPGLRRLPTQRDAYFEELEFIREADPARAPPAGVTHDIDAGARRAAAVEKSKQLGGASEEEKDAGIVDVEAGGATQPPSKAAASPGKGADRVKDSSQDGEATLPFRPMAMTFKDIAYSVPVPKGMDTSHADVPTEGPHANALRLLSGINGVFQPGVLTALMGASGAGKTTLMDVLAGRKTGGTVTGEVHINGFPKNQATFNRISGYVEQEDIHLSQTTVGEAAQFSAALRLPASVSPATRREFVDDTLRLVEMDKLRDSHVGSPGVSGLSIQARKRLTIAVELVANPSIIFMDEPTTGLDARAASVVMATVRNVVNTGRTVVCTIHQPSLDIFEAFDELLLLKPGGRCIFFGPIGFESKALTSYFSGTKGVEPIKPGYNPANWMLEQTSPVRESALGVNFADVYASSELAGQNLERLTAAHDPAPGAEDIDEAQLREPSPTAQFAQLLRRNFVMYWRAPDYNMTRLLVTLLVGFVFGSLAWKQGDETGSTDGVINIAGLLFASTMFLGLSNCMTVQPIADQQRSVMYRERAAGMYGVMPYSFAQCLVELPYLVVQDIIYSAIVYWMVAFSTDASKFLWFMFIFGLSLCYFTAFGIMALNLLPELAFGNLITSFFFGFWNLMCGFLIPRGNIPGWWIWCYYLSPVSWSLYGLIVSQLGDLDDSYIVDFSGQVVPVPDFIEDYLGYSYDMLWPCVGILLAFIVVFLLISGLSLKLVNYQNR